MSDRRVILITPGDQFTTAAVDLLIEWAGHGLIHPFVSCAGDKQPVDAWPSGVTEASSVFEILARQKLEMVRVVTLAGSDLEVADELEARARRTVDKIKALAPPGLRVLEARIWSPRYPSSDHKWRPPENLFDPNANANLVLVPEDRRTEEIIAIPLTGDDDAFEAHIATEVATALGMWSGMSEAPVDKMDPGVIGFGEAKVHLVRSFMRVAVIPAVTLAGAADHGGALRVPSGCLEAPYPRETLGDAQGRIEHLLRASLVGEAPVDGPEGAGIAEVLRAIGRGVLGSLRYMFTISRDVVDALRDMTGRIIQDAVGHDSVLRVVWRGMPPDGEEGAGAFDAAELIGAVRRRRSLEGGVRIDQQLWIDVGKAVFSVADGGDMPQQVAPLQIQGRAVIVKEVGMISPAYGPDLADDIRADASGDASTTLLGRLGAYLRRAEQDSRREFAGLVERSKTVFEVEQLRALTPAGVVAAGLITLAVSGLLVLSGLIELTGVTGMGRMARAWTWGVVTGGYALTLAALSRAVAARFRSEHPASSRAAPPPATPSRASTGDEEDADEGDTNGADDESQPVDGVVSSAGGPRAFLGLPGIRGVVILSALAGLVVGVMATSGTPALDALALGVSVALATYAIALAIQLDRRLYRSLETFRQVRLLFFLTVIYGAFGLVGLLARDPGWYGDRSLEGFADLWIGEAVAVLLILLLLAAMAFDSFRRDQRARTKISDLERGIVSAVDTQWKTEEAFEQFIASAAAWAGVIWKPFGETDPGHGRMREDLDFDVLKAETRPFVVTPLGAIAMRERMMKELARPGWLGRRYETAVDAYRRRRAIETGSEPSAVLRPDQDPREVQTVAPGRRPDVSGRWRFVADLIAGAYNRDLAQALAASDHAGAAEWVYRQHDTLEASETGGTPLDRYLGTVTSHTPSEVSYVYLDQDALKDADRSLRTTMWWPSALIDLPDGSRPQASHIRSLVNGDLAVMAVRHDRAGPFTPANLFGKPAVEDDDAPDQEGGAPRL